jgi:starch-binding outer membrane protein, SusD/RagB family
MKNKIILFIIAAGCVGAFSCKKSFLDRPSETTPTVENYYNNAEEVNGATGLLYNFVWNRWFDKAFISVGDVLGGTVTGTAGDANYNSFYNFNIQSTDGLIADTWYSCYKAAGNASVLIHTFEGKKSQVGDASYLDLGIAEAKFIRGFAYFYIARTFKDVPIVDNPITLTQPGQSLVPRYIQSDVFKFALEDLKVAEAKLPAVAYQPGRITKYSAKGLMAKIYLYLGDYENAKAKAKEVIDYATANPDKVGLHPDFQYIFTTSQANNNKESLFALQWLTAMGWNGGCRYQLYVGPRGLLAPLPTGGNGYSSVIPSLDMLDPATGWATGDKRREWSIMEHGFQKAEWVNDNFPNGYRYDTTVASGENGNGDFKIKNGTRSSILKYVVGPNRPGEPVNNSSHSSMCTYILRYADVLLIYAEAILGSSASTTDAAALAAFNQVHGRARLPNATSLTKDMILRERKCEFAFEGEYWFDISRQGHAKAMQMIAAQERGTYDFNKRLTSFKVTNIGANQLYLPIPQSETVLNPKLLEAPVPYY